MAKKDWGGKWTEEKLDVFEKYVKAYLTIMNKNRDKFGWKLIYFDAFAGSGSRKTEENEVIEKELFDITKEEQAVYRGAAERVVNIDLRGFDLYYFIESDTKSKNELEAKLEKVKTEKVLNLQFRSGNANEYLRKLSELMTKSKNIYSLTIIDPFGMQVDWETVKQLEGTNTDLWILIPSGVIINRLLDRKRKLPYIKKLVSFFGLSEEEIRDYFYEKNTNASLFDMDDYKKISGAIQKIAELYIKRLQTIFPKVTTKPLVMVNSRNNAIYHFAFASKNATALKIANDIIGRDSL